MTVRPITFSLDAGGDFGVVPVGTVSAAKTATLRNLSRFKIAVLSSKLTNQFKARFAAEGGAYAADLGAFSLGEYFTPGASVWLSTGSRNLGTDPFETGVLIGTVDADGRLTVGRRDFWIEDGEFLLDDNDEPIEFDR
jgi:hypothetical protein